MTIRPIKNKKDYLATLEQIDALWESPIGSPEADIVEVLSILIEEYEKKHYKIYPPKSIDAILFRMDQLGMTATDLGKLIGGKNRASELLNGKRPLTLERMRTLYKELKIPAESLIN